MDKEHYEKLETAYNRLSVLHTETMLELVETQKRLEEMPYHWWPMFKLWVKRLWKK